MPCHAMPHSQQGHLDGWQVISKFLIDVSIPQSYVDRLSDFESVFPKLHVHYLDMVPVKALTRHEDVSVQGRFHIALNNGSPMSLHPGA